MTAINTNIDFVELEFPMVHAKFQKCKVKAYLSIFEVKFKCVLILYPFYID